MVQLLRLNSDKFTRDWIDVGFTNSTPTVASLKALSAPPDAATYTVLGYYAAGDGGGGTYVWNATDTTTDNGGTVIQPSAGGVGRWNLVPAGPISIAQFGAKADGVTDNSAAMQAALNSLAATGGPVFCPQFGTGAFAFATGLTIPFGVYIRGAGKYATILKYTGTGTALTQQGSGNQKVGISDLTLQLTGAGAIGLDASQMISSTFSSFRVVGTGPGGTQIGIQANITAIAQNSYFNVFEDQTFDGLGTGLYIDSNVNQRANRWRFVAPTWLSCGICVNIQNIQGIQFVLPYQDQFTVAGWKLGGTVGRLADRIMILGAIDETQSGGTGWVVDAATCKNLEVIGLDTFSAAFGFGFPAQIGLQGTILGNAITIGRQSSGTKPTGIAISIDANQDAVGEQFAGVESISGTTTQGKNLRGQLIISAGNTTGQVNFPTAEPDANYFINVTPTASTGVPAAGSNRVVSVSKLAGSFTVTIEAAPGGAATVTFDWVLIR